MSEKNSAKEGIKPQSSQNEDQIDTNEIANDKPINKNNAVLSVLKNTPQDEDTALNINNLNENLNNTDDILSINKNTVQNNEVVLDIYKVNNNINEAIALLSVTENITQNNDIVLDITNVDKNLKTADGVLSVDQITAQNEVVLLNINNVTNVNFKTGDPKQSLTYGEYGNRIPPQSTWVFFQTGSRLPDDQNALEYDPSSRNSFVALVFGIVFVMILITAGFVASVLFNANMKNWFIINGFVAAIPAMVLMLGLNYAMACSGCARMFPCNIICLVLAVIGMSVICAYITVHYKTRIVFYAVVATSIVVFVCMCLAFSSFDFTAWMLYIVVIAAAFGAIALVVSLTMLITGTYMKMVHLAILIVSTLISVAVITMELQMILGGRTVEIGEDDYALAAFLLYSSIVDVFIKMVQILGILDNM